MTGHRLRPSERLKRSADFRRVYDRRCSASDGVLIIYGSINDLPHSRVGLSVGRKVGGAVRRNRWKRLIREAYRLAHQLIPSGVDWIVIPRGGKPPTLKVLMTCLCSLTSIVYHRLERESKVRVK